ncbi:glycosyltransferase family 4 protein [Amphiplicatus metriothermophilus]|uniref:Glycosyltransferase involved in cell wall bisynthesis n=1 Tax=Amphiplicatus metriothermophilus TaxID=1519374 RepID=A0A239PJA1_9PROT|nr:glycosyltransferase family 4 protein [Amphiplicatus metriothermophilus]MBB5517818.1 glycosyltransferase involved in cell wall biosynthesis [Amphiplicatus metriothermophilus]SNT67848.1 Glycosyltransferase involved in cell wall bisynthesis [Amphiplicatus metriothermophilus]
MKILYSHRTRSADGQYVHIRALTAALAARGVRVFMAGPDDFGEDAGERPLDARAGEDPWRRRLPRALHEIAELAYSLPAHARLARAARAFRPDILYERYNLFHHAGAWLARRRGLPFLLEVNASLSLERAGHGGLASPGLACASERAIWRAADMALPVSLALARLVEDAGVPPERIAVIRNGVERAFLEPADPAPARARYGLEGKIVLGFAGFARDWHGLDRVLRYLAARRRDDLVFLLVGDGPARASLEALAGRLGVEGRFILAGVAQREAMPGLIAAFDVALLPAATPYASPLKLTEYMALGRAIVAPDQANIRELVEPGCEALLAPPEDDGAFFAALDALVDDADLRVRLGAAARARVLRDELTWPANAARVERLAASLLERRS